MWALSKFLIIILCAVGLSVNFSASEDATTTVLPPTIITDEEVESQTDSSEQSEAHDEQVTLGVLVDLHDGTSEGQDEEMRNDSIPGVLCGALNLRAFQQLAAVRWATEFLNERSWANEYGLDVVVHDTCGESGIALSETHQLIEWAKENPDTPLVGVIVIGSRNNERIIDKPLELLNKENISTIVTSSRAAELLLSKHHNVFTTAPDISSVAEATVALIRELESKSVAVISSCSHAMKRFQKIATERNVPAKHFFILEKDNLLIVEAVLKFLTGEARSSRTVVLLLEPIELGRLLRNTKHLKEFEELVDQKTWLIGSVGMDEELIHEWSMKLKSKLFIVEPHVSPNPDFNKYFLDNLKGALAAEPSEETQEYIERTYGCEWSISEEESKPSQCRNLTSQVLNQKFHPDPDVSFIVNAVSAYSAALRLAQLQTCGEDKECDHSQTSTAVIDALRNLNFPTKVTEGSGEVAEGSTDPTIATEHELEGTRGRINYQGKLVSRRYNVLYSEPTQKISRVGQYSHEQGLIMDSSFTMPVETTYIAQSSNPKKNVVSATIPRGRAGKESSGDLLQERLGQDEMDDQLSRQRMSPEFYISRIWALVVVAIGITGVFLALYMLVYVLLKMCDGTLHGNQTFGILLLLSLMILYSSVVLFVLPPGPLLCTLRVFIPSLALAFSFGILLLKAMQLRSIVQLGLGGRISIFNQFVTLVFIVAVQLAINLQWFLSRHEEEDENISLSQLNDCFHPHQTYLFLHSYIGILIVFVFLYGVSVLKIRRNFNEARWITLTALFSVPVIIGWVVVVLFGPPDYQEPAASVSFLAFPTVILFIIFVPKLGTISKQSSLSSRKRMLQQGGPGYHTGSISTIFTTLGSERGLGTLQSQKRSGGSHTHYSASPPLPPPPPHSHHSHAHTSSGKCVSYSPRLATNVFHSSSNASSSMQRSTPMKTPFFSSSHGGAYP